MLLLPRRSAAASGVLTVLKVLAIPLLILGAIGLGKVLLPTLRGGSEYERIAEEHFGAWILMLLMTGGVFAGGGILWFIAQHYTFDKAPLGTLVQFLFEGLATNKDISKLRTIASSICSQTQSDSDESTPRLFARAFAFQVLAETSSEEKESLESAAKATHDFKRLKELDVNTPLVHFGLATSLRIMKENRQAIESYETYLSMRPDDEQTKSIMEDLAMES